MKLALYDLLLMRWLPRVAVRASFVLLRLGRAGLNMQHTRVMRGMSGGLAGSLEV